MKIRLGLGDGMYVVSPKPDITPYESAQLTVLLLSCIHAGAMGDDRKAFVEANGLLRHMDKEAATEPKQKGVRNEGDADNSRRPPPARASLAPGI